MDLFRRDLWVIGNFVLLNTTPQVPKRLCLGSKCTFSLKDSPRRNIFRSNRSVNSKWRRASKGTSKWVSSSSSFASLHCVLLLEIQCPFRSGTEKGHREQPRPEGCVDVSSRRGRLCHPVACISSLALSGLSVSSPRVYRWVEHRILPHVCPRSNLPISSQFLK